MPKERNDEGKFTKTTDENEIVQVIEEQSDPVTTSRRVAETLGISQAHTTRKLKELHDEGVIERMEVGAKAAVFWVNND